ncbi:RNA-guided pseudouridylation complex pseudouridine synthase subunit Cbf5 [Halobaculum sp. CBA1158]|uniref:RNA-guided pseudouridylation complex pseudouridine synthase subunit Cbf5 n=1 Tax=Halobaculum sp. CBA1158 TaxID=2904243 RepID=UPI001F239365|nr:RNA-guided pseudouridylation complex pseudouridine synthase subunit Cbf5 [Halobaculum sp. CBA1158]UIO99419.1 RNA-guided pseudouridylation complex pseudouridine synthase subunit Cbf5 [Halobaculum sp. CBA1158]
MRPAPEERTVAELAAFGVVNLDKPAGPSAHQVAAWVRDRLDVDRAAHAGTLDPKVTGCLPTLTGDATRLAQVFLEGTKEYVAVLELHAPAPTDLERVIAEFEGDLYQKPPRKSAVTRRLRTREVSDLDVLDRTDRQVLLRIRCESGTYVRKLCHDIGLALGTGGHMGHLRRTATDPFDDRDLHTLHDLIDGVAFAEGEDAVGGRDTDAGAPDESLLREVLRPAEEALTGLPSLTIADSAAREVAEGAPVYAPGVVAAGDTGSGAPAEGDLLACYTPDGAAVCLGRLVGDPDADAGEVVDLERVLV